VALGDELGVSSTLALVEGLDLSRACYCWRGAAQEFAETGHLASAAAAAAKCELLASKSGSHYHLAAAAEAWGAAHDFERAARLLEARESAKPAATKGHDGLRDGADRALQWIAIGRRGEADRCVERALAAVEAECRERESERDYRVEVLTRMVRDAAAAGDADWTLSWLSRVEDFARALKAASARSAYLHSLARVALGLERKELGTTLLREAASLRQRASNAVHSTEDLMIIAREQVAAGDRDGAMETRARLLKVGAKSFAKNPGDTGQYLIGAAQLLGEIGDVAGTESLEQTLGWDPQSLASWLASSARARATHRSGKDASGAADLLEERIATVATHELRGCALLELAMLRAEIGPASAREVPARLLKTSFALFAEHYRDVAALSAVARTAAALGLVGEALQMVAGFSGAADTKAIITVDALLAIAERLDSADDVVLFPPTSGWAYWPRPPTAPARAHRPVGEESFGLLARCLGDMAQL
jgi:hypothetical protein